MEVYVHKCQKCGEDNVLDKKPVAAIEVNCHNCGAVMTVGGKQKAATVADATK